MITRLRNWKGPSPKARRAALIALLGLQTVFFFLLLKRPLQVEADNTRYEVAGYNLAIGRGLSLPLSETRDRTVYGWVCDRHPAACAADTTHPIAIYPPGYSFLIAGVYKIFGRSLVALQAVQLALLLLTFWLYERLCAHYLTGVGYLFAVGVACVYPFIARQATMVMSDHLHVATVMLALAAFTLMRPGLWRGVVFGLLMSLSTLTRPYGLLLFPLLLILPSIWRAAHATGRERLVAGLVFAIPLALWTARNAYWFGRFIPLTTNGPGILLVHTTLDWSNGNQDEEDSTTYYQRVWSELGGHDASSYEGDQRARALAMSRIRERPGQFVLSLLKHAPRVWISLGPRHGVSRAWPLLLLFMGGLLVLGVWGMWLKRRDEAWRLPMLTVLVYWGSILYTPGDSRRTLPLRLAMLLFAAVAVDRLVARSPAAAPAPATGAGNG